jgi:hypothetical protein
MKEFFSLLFTEKETTLCFNEAMVFSEAPEMRFLFCSLTMQGFPTLHLLEVPYLHAMTKDYRYKLNVIQTTEGIMNALLCDLQHIFVDNNHTLVEYGLPPANEYPTELERERMRYSDLNKEIEELQYKN